ncbi:MAG TPA: chromosome segregation protein SMC [Gammaproteobacteria bacterium]|nr:chromosome segregation protein SMC [Gammaproteobacteria bacterium]
MLLKKIKLSGFKSFVDPTTVPIPSHLVAIVGPNGCGKSNIIDAVCWVMGESSAKYLRGESLTDVIFNGSNTRKPVGQASVELVFDNQDGSLGGEYASYSEISIRRMINRDSDSSYFLNGTRCRRKDIIDIFLGTGLGPRSYSIIGQNMISRLIEAKPDDMRTYLEEAAGISKYKERRRETENRIQHTQENMARLDDVRIELEKQLNTLKRQANAAERFKALKQEERVLRAQWLAAEWRQFDAKLIQYTLQIQQQETSLEAKQAELSELNLNIDKKRDEHHDSNEIFQEIQRRYYVAGNEITRIEQDIHHTKERQRQWQTDVLQVESDWTDVKNSLEEIENELAELTEELQKLEPELYDAKQAGKIAADAYSQAEEAVLTSQNQWDQFNHLSAKTTQTAQVEQTRIVHLEHRLAAIKQRKMQLEQEQAQINFTELDQEIHLLSEQLAQINNLSSERTQQLNAARQAITSEQSAQQEINQQLDQVRSQVQRLKGQQASLEALQQTALGQRNNPVTEWLKKRGLEKLPRLAQHLEVESGWELAVEKVLGMNLQAVCVDELSHLTDALDDLKQGNLCVFAGPESKKSHSAKAALLLDKIKSKWPLDSLLANIFIAENCDEALSLCKSLAPHESVMTRDGIWLNSSWLRVSREENPAAGVFQREQELKQLSKQISELLQQQTELEEKLQQTKEQLKKLEDEREQFQHAVNQSHSEMAKKEAERKMKQERLTELHLRAERFRRELEESSKQYEQTQTELTQSRSIWQQAMSDLEGFADRREALEKQRGELRERQQISRQKLNETKEAYHQLEIRQQTTQSQRSSLQQTIQRMQAQLATLAERKTALQTDSFVETDLPELEKILARALSERLQIEEELNASRHFIQTIEYDVRQLENERQNIEREIAKVRDMLETVRLEAQSLKVKIETIQEKLNETHQNLEDVLKELPEDLASDVCHQKLDDILARISRLGPINLVAIEEYASSSERKEYLDKQHADLLEGLTTLQNAIAKIDKETRARFKETFDKVSERFQELFPKIFGGGRAYLELTGENLLESGVTVMACPPGKRNSTIHLLSGGEKAMTAIALIFSIFHLNPAPFCLLDEVDAPLDDANIGRFCELVKTMAEKTQFIFISHNKLAIEMGEHLMGVTMHEPGVSRLVSVSVDEAVSLAIE